jgi:hypothetical protein
MLWNSLMCLNYLDLRSLLCGSKPDSWTFDFIKNSTQIINIFSKVQQNEKSFDLCWNGKGITYFPYKGLTITSFNHPKVKIKVGAYAFEHILWPSFTNYVYLCEIQFLERLIVIFIEFPMTRNTQNLVVSH